ncbi:Lysine-specific demethylase 3A-B [Hibiscus syriacus]|uniref:peroxidase n=1 Tax=Hibiscus syriacus TaxID=106335 RepID=A0A6A2ZXK2_HIBSY|nr:Lysine-specific demethylase 3A-B [Hibiscus syriacus]
MVRLMEEGMRNHTCFMLILRQHFGACEAQLAYDYYKFACPNVESTVRNAVLGVVFTDPTAPASFLRLLFQDCQVQGCDASILLDSKPLDGNFEIASGMNFGIRKKETIHLIKYKLEAECPGRVSCADIIAFAAKVSVALSGGPNIQIPLGRKDSTTSSRHAADVKIPPPNITVDTLLDVFVSKGLDLEESVAIMGAHTLGGGHCINIVDRLFDGQPDDLMNPSFKAMLRLLCPTKKPLTNLTIVPNDKISWLLISTTVNMFLMGKDLFTIDSRI